jgi:hypothetical protein
VFAASSLDGAAREQYAAMEAGGGAVEAPPQKRGSSKTGQPQAAAAENRSGPFGHDFLFFSLFFFFFFPHLKVFFFQKKGARAADWSRGHMLTYTARAVDVGRVPARKASQGKRDNTCYLENHVLRGTRIDRSIAARDVLNSKKATARPIQLPLLLKVSS